MKANKAINLSNKTNLLEQEAAGRQSAGAVSRDFPIR